MSFWSEWQKGIRNRNYFILQELLKRSEVDQIIGIDYLPINFKQKIKILVVRFKIYDFSFKNTIDVVSDKYTNVSVLSKATYLSDIQQIQHSYFKNHKSKTIIWSYYPLNIEYFNKLSADIKIFDAVDNWYEHPNYHNQLIQLQKNYNQIKQKADIIFTVSKSLRDDLFLGNQKVHWIPNGVNLKQLKKQNVKSKFTIQNSKKTIGYIGTIQSRIDFKLIKFIAKHHPDKNFVFVGPVWEDAEIYRVKNLNNIMFIGQVPYDKIGHYLSKFDVAIIPHKIDQFTRSMNPMKFYEYCAYGLPVVSTYKIENDRELLYVAKNKENFAQLINQAINENNQNLINQRLQFAKQNSWFNRVNQMLKIISKLTMKIKLFNFETCTNG